MARNYICTSILFYFGPLRGHPSKQVIRWWHGDSCFTTRTASVTGQTSFYILFICFYIPGSIWDFSTSTRGITLYIYVAQSKYVSMRKILDEITEKKELKKQVSPLVLKKYCLMLILQSINRHVHKHNVNIFLMVLILWFITESGCTCAG